MNVLDNIFRVFMFVLPYAVCFAAYTWVAKRAWKTTNTIARIIALFFVIGGIGFTVYRLIRNIGGIFTNDDFEFVILIVMVFVLFFASVAMAIGEPEKE